MRGIWKALPQWMYPIFTVLLKPGSNIPPLNLPSLQSIHIHTGDAGNMPTGGWPVCHVIAKLLSFSSACLLMWDYVRTTFFVLQVLFIKWCVDRGLEVRTCMYIRLTSNILHGHFAQATSHVANDNQNLDQWGMGCHGNSGVLPPVIEEELHFNRSSKLWQFRQQHPSSLHDKRQTNKLKQLTCTMVKDTTHTFLIISHSNPSSNFVSMPCLHTLAGPLLPMYK